MDTRDAQNAHYRVYYEGNMEASSRTLGGAAAYQAFL